MADGRSLSVWRWGLACGTELTGFGIDDFAIAARDKAGKVYSITLEVRDEDGGVYLDGNPLVTITAVGRSSE